MLRLAVLSICLLLAAAPAATHAADRPNVLLICIDDLRPELGCYGEAHMKTPHLDRLAAQGRLFRRHFVHLPTCGASRFAMLTGQYPRRASAYGNGAFGALKAGDKIVTLPEAFRSAGYTTVSLGKISHQPDGHVFSYDGKGDGRVEMPDAWDEVTGPKGKWDTAWHAFFGYADGTNRTTRRGEKKPAPGIEGADVDDAGYPDGLLAEMAIERLGKLAPGGGGTSGGKPFFLAVGFFKPHLPITAPRKYWDLYKEADIELAPWREKPRDLASGIPMHGSGEFRGYTHPADANRDDAYARRVRHAYFAAVSYVDAQVGKLLAELDRTGLADNTIVIVWGDHGWHLGDHSMWGKHTLFERSLHSALIVRTPKMNKPGEAIDALIGSVDIYPTLAALCGLDAPDDLDGRSFTKALDDPEASGKPYVRGFWKAGGNTGETYRFDDKRITLWRKGDAVGLVEVYDHAADPHETRNVAAEHPDIVERIDRLSATPAD